MAQSTSWKSTNRRRRSPRNRDDIADFVRQRVREGMDQAADRTRLDGNLARAVHAAKPHTTTAVRGTLYVEIMDRRAQRHEAQSRS